MIGLFLGTSEGKNILSLLNKYTEDIFISTATEYGGELLKDYKYKILNTNPLDKEGIEKIIVDNGITLLVDASHPYALIVTQNAKEACKACNIEYVRYERPSIVKKYEDFPNVIVVENYDELYPYLKEIQGNILNTTGSRNIEKIMNMDLSARVIHRVLPSLKVMEELHALGVQLENIIAIKGPISYELNCSFIKEYNAKAIIMKDSGPQGGTEEKLKAAIDLGLQAFVIGRSTVKYENVFNNEKELVDYLKDK